jgi:hypothetical protein
VSIVEILPVAHSISFRIQGSLPSANAKHALSCLLNLNHDLYRDHTISSMSVGILPRCLRLAVPRLPGPPTLLEPQPLKGRPSITWSRWYSDNPKVQGPALEVISSINDSKIVPRLPTSIKRLNKQLATRQSPDLPEDELEEKFVRGELSLGYGRFLWVVT